MRRREWASDLDIFEVCGLRYAAIHRNPEALALFRANRTSLVAKKKRTKRKSNVNDDDAPPPRDRLLNYKKPQLVERLRTTQQQLLELQQQFAVQAEAGVMREARIAEQEAKLAELEPYRSFVEQMHAQMQREEQGRFGKFPSDMEGVAEYRVKTVCSAIWHTVFVPLLTTNADMRRRESHGDATCVFG